MGVACYMSYAARDIPTLFQEGKYLSIAMISNLQVSAIGTHQDFHLLPMYRYMFQRLADALLLCLLFNYFPDQIFVVGGKHTS